MAGYDKTPQERRRASGATPAGTGHQPHPGPEPGEVKEQELRAVVREGRSLRQMAVVGSRKGGGVLFSLRRGVEGRETD